MRVRHCGLMTKSEMNADGDDGMESRRCERSHLKVCAMSELELKFRSMHDCVIARVTAKFSIFIRFTSARTSSGQSPSHPPSTIERYDAYLLPCYCSEPHQIDRYLNCVGELQS